MKLLQEIITTLPPGKWMGTLYQTPGLLLKTTKKDLLTNNIGNSSVGTELIIFQSVNSFHRIYKLETLQ